MKTKQLLGLSGSILLFMGVFAPIVRIPIVGNMNYFANGRGDGVFVSILAVTSLILALAEKYRGLLYMGIGSLATMFFSFMNFQQALADVKAKVKAAMESELKGNQFRDLVDTAMGFVQFQWGLALLVVGAVFVIASSVIEDNDYLPVLEDNDCLPVLEDNE